MKKRLWSILWIAAFVCLNITPVSAEETAWTTEGETEYGYYYAEFAANQQGTHRFTLEDYGAFSCEWDGVFNYRAEVGEREYFSRLRIDSFAGISALRFYYTANVNAKGNCYYGIHGCFGPDMPEIFIVEGWGIWRPPGGNNRIGQRWVDGKSYDYYAGTQCLNPADENSPRIKVVYAVAETSDITLNKECNVSKCVDFGSHIRNLVNLDRDYSKLFNAKLEYATLFAEGYGGYGGDSSCKFTVDSLCIDLSYPNRVPNPVNRGFADKNGVFFLDDYENGIGNAYQYGITATLDIMPQYHADGTQSLVATNRSSDWEGVAYRLDYFAIIPDTSYSFQAAVMHNGYGEVTFSLTLEYWNDGGWPEFKELETVEAKCGEWTILRCPDFQVPSCGSKDTYVKDACLFIESVFSTEDYYVDSACLSEAGALPEISLADCVPPLPEKSGGNTDMIRERKDQTGDANCDGTVDVADAVLIMRYAVEDREAVITDQGKLNSDTDGDGSVSAEDAKLILLFIAKKIGSLSASGVLP